MLWNPHWFDSMANEFFRISLINGVLAREITGIGWNSEGKKSGVLAPQRGEYVISRFSQLPTAESAQQVVADIRIGSTACTTHLRGFSLINRVLTRKNPEEINMANDAETAGGAERNT